MFQKLMDRLSAQFADQKPFVVYKKPKQDRITAILQNTDILHLVTNFKETGFVISTFERDLTVLLKMEEKHEVEINQVISSNHKDTGKKELDLAQKKAYLELVVKAIAAIKQGDFKKVVLSRQIEACPNKAPLELFRTLLVHYPNAFCYLWYHPKVGLWLGATPEMLLHVRHKEFTTISLAGTQPYPGSAKVLWGQKELEEQSWVTQFILEVLRDKTKRIKTGGVESIQAGKLLHLRTKINGTLLENKGLPAIIDALHPTPAVCGFPKEAAQLFIKENENYDRQFYTGFLGELNFDGATDLYVNLRCAQIKDNKAILYTGGGITMNSDPEKEWKETVAKSRTLLDFL